MSTATPSAPGRRRDRRVGMLGVALARGGCPHDAAPEPLPRRQRRPSASMRGTVEGRISPLLYGQFIEFMYEGIKRGLHAELIRNRSFEEGRGSRRPLPRLEPLPGRPQRRLRHVQRVGRHGRVSRHGTVGGAADRALAARRAPSSRDRAAWRLSGPRAGQARARVPRLALDQSRGVHGRRHAWRSKAT